MKFETEWEVNLKYLVIEYFRTNFAFDFLASIPCLVTGEQVMWLYPLKIMRIIRLARIISFLEQLSQIFKKANMRQQIFIENFFHVLITVLVLIVAVHVLACSFIAIGLERNESDNPLTPPWILDMGLDQEPNFDGPFAPDTSQRIYWVSWYFVITSITTVGYGDISSYTKSEMMFNIFLVFVGIIVFSTIQHRTGQLRHVPLLKDHLRQAYDQAIDFLF